jgi:phosphoserine aminotransferase
MIAQTPEAGTDRRRLHNFSAGPGALPESVMLEVRDELPLYGDVGSSIMEISHRSSAYSRVEESAKESLRTLLGLGPDWHIVFLQGGASMQFYQVPLNFLPPGGSADYLVTGAWAKKALEEARRCGTARVAASSKDQNFNYIPRPEQWDLDPNAAYLHYTSNNTIFGTQYHFEPEASVPLVCDASSDFLSRRIETDRYGLIYAGAQKNVGPAGTTVVLIRDAFLERRNPDLPTMLDYGTHTADLFNTPPVFAVYIVEKVLRWIRDNGGLEGMERRNDEKANLLYGAIDETGFYRGTAREDSRSKMNVTFRLADESLESAFISEAKKEGLLELGGVRASIYNAIELSSVEALVSFMREFERRNG